MRSEKEIIDMMQALKTRQKFFEEQELYEETQETIYPDPVDESANKILALQWVLGSIDDLFVYPETRTKFNQEMRCLNIIQDINRKREIQKRIKDILKGQENE
jgi:hypothetical protein